jgi:hypothetical protein
LSRLGIGDLGMPLVAEQVRSAISIMIGVTFRANLLARRKNIREFYPKYRRGVTMLSAPFSATGSCHRPATSRGAPGPGAAFYRPSPAAIATYDVPSAAPLAAPAPSHATLTSLGCNRCLK